MKGNSVICKSFHCATTKAMTFFIVYIIRLTSVQVC